MMEHNIKEASSKQITITQTGNQVLISSRNLLEFEDTIDLFLKGTLSVIRTAIPTEFIEEFLNIYIESLRELNESFDLLYSKSNHANSESLEESVNNDNSENKSLEEIINTLSNKIKNNEDIDDNNENPFCIVGHD